MKNISGALRIYIVLSCVWFVYFLDEISLGMCVGELHSNYEIKYNPANSFIENFISCNYLTDFISFKTLFAIK